MGFDLDHTSFAVGDALAHAARLRREFGAVPIAGETLAEFRYLLLYAGTVERGARIELLEPTGPGFLTRFLETSGEGPHHITITVPDLADAVMGARNLGLKVVGESYDHPGWREAFVMPDAVHGTVIQLASSEHTYPSPTELLATRDRDIATMPAVLGATDQFWWESVWETEPDGEASWLGATHLVSNDLRLSRDLFEGVLGGRVDEQEDGFRVSWPSGAIQIRSGEPVGVERVERHGAGTDWAIGRCGFTSTG
jgi:catechol 2,3-dioxygenase-like lactoylglutathione lyase family enzyme